MIRKTWVWMVLTVCTLIIVTANLFMTLKLSEDLEMIQADPSPRRSLPCQAIPIRFATDHPDCVNELLYHMNVTNVRFLSRINLSK